MSTGRWFYTLYMNSEEVSIFNTSEYGSNQGYASEKEAILAAINGLNKEIEKHRSAVSSASKSLINLTMDNMKLVKKLGEVK